MNAFHADSIRPKHIAEARELTLRKDTDTLNFLTRLFLHNPMTSTRSLLVLSLLTFAVACGDDDRGPMGTICSGEEVDIQTDERHCGQCNSSCLTGETCENGMCSGSACAPNERECGGECVNVQTSRDHCGFCFTPCGSSCINGICGGGVDGGTDIGGSDVPPGDCNPPCDTTRSNACGMLPGSSINQCLCGMTSQCPVGQACVNNGSGPLCTSLQTDPNNCGAIGNMCNEGESCNGGVCGCGGAGPCGAGSACCDGACVDVQANAMNCGACGMECAVGESCSAGACGCGGGASCRAPVAGLPGLPGDAGQACCGGTCVENTDASCLCMACTGEDTCQVAGSLLDPSAPVEVCCGDERVAFLGCGGFPL